MLIKLWSNSPAEAKKKISKYYLSSWRTESCLKKNSERNKEILKNEMLYFLLPLTFFLELK